MRLTFVCKRFPQQRDLLTRPYGRFYHLPVGLAKLGHDVQVILVSHRGLDSVVQTTGSVHWSSDDLRSLGPARLHSSVLSHASSFAPDWVVGLSDAPYGWLAQNIAARLGASLAIDAYDDYEAYMPWNFPLHALWRRAIRRADLVTAAGPQLAALLQTHRNASKTRPIAVVPMAADPSFVPMEKARCRAALGLPMNSPLIGYAGAWAHRRGTNILITALRNVRKSYPDAHLVLSGRPPPEVTKEAGVIALGYLPDASLPTLLNAVDLACIIGAETKFGRHSYPSKLCEAMACGTAVVASATAPVRWMLNEESRWLVPPASPQALTEHILQNLHCGKVEYRPQLNWTDLSVKFSELLASRPG